MVIMAPADENECRQMLYTGFKHEGPAAVRYPRGKGPGIEVAQEMSMIPLGQSRMLRTGRRVAILAFGSMVEPCLGIADQLDATLIDMRFIKPLDRQAVQTSVQHHEFLVTVEENAIAGGAGSGVNELVAAMGKAIPTLNIGLTDTFIQHGTREECLQQAGLDAGGILRQITEFLDQRTPDSRSLSSVQ
jgi:1-deoxy-D-xylulose-5-phosphate synthase